MGVYTQNQLGQIANKLNYQPRKTLQLKTPAEVFIEVSLTP
jgi:IS30 family transposase